MVELERPPAAADRKHPHPLLKIALELGPLGVFFFANARGAWLAERFPALAALGDPSRPESQGIFIATALFIVATVISLTVSLAMTRRLPVMPFVTGIIVLVFGGLTLWLQNETFIKMKPTIVNTLFGLVLLGGLVFRKSLVGYVFDSVFQLTDEGWRKLTLRWGMFFFLLAALNEIVWRSFSTDFWVAFKVFGIMPLTLVFTFTQIPLIMREQKPARAPAGE
jgi:intracellular septation protein